MADRNQKAEIQKLVDDLPAEEESAEPGVLMQRLKHILNIPGEITGLDERDVYAVESRLRNDVRNLVVSTSEYSPTELVQKASAGVIVRGVLVDKGKNLVSLKRNVLAPPSNVTLMNAALPQTEQSFMFSSKAHHDSFQKDLNNIGYSHAAEAHISYLAFKGEAGVKCSENRTSEKFSKIHDQSNFESVCNIVNIPLAACQLNYTDRKLSPDVVTELKGVEKVMKISASKEKCKQFFDTYGTHVKLGTIHFGGSIRFVAKYQSHQRSNRTHVKNALKSAVKAYASASFKMGGFGIGGSVSAEQLKFSSDENQQFDKSELSNITCETVVNGGPIGIGSIPLWKYGLSSYNTTWAVIDNGTADDFVGIWDLVKGHSSDFEEPEQLAYFLREVWKQLYGGKSETHDHDKLFAIEMLLELEPKLADWNSSSNTSGETGQHLEDVVKLVRKIEGSVHSSQHWIDFLCKNSEINSFFSNIVKEADRYSQTDKIRIRQMLRELVQPVQEVYFPSRNDVIPWIRASDQQYSSPPVKQFSVHDIDQLTKELKEIIFKSEMEILVQQGQKQQKDMLTDFVLCLESFLTLCRDKCQVFLTSILLQTVGYNKDYKTFNRDITLDAVKDFLKNLMNTWSDYCNHKSMGKMQSEAFLFHVFLTLEDACPTKTKEERFTTFLLDIESELSNNLVDAVKMYTSSSPFKWEKIKGLLQQLMQGNMSFGTQSNDDRCKLEKLTKAAKEMPLRTVSEPSQSPTVTYTSILEMLDLVDYYPRKLTLLDAMKLRQTTAGKLSDIPWIFINKLFKGDLYARDSTMTPDKTTDSSEDDGFDDFLSETDKPETTGMPSTLDVLVVLFGCCDSFLQQALVQKLFQCKLAIPFVYPLGTPNEMMLSIWALRTVEINGALVTDTPLPVVAFLRLGQLPHFSKSKLMNDILSDNNHHTFVNYHCENGTQDRLLSNGLVECSWYVKATRQETVSEDRNTLSSSMMMLNLRGDASKHPSQREMLCKISSVVVVLTTANELERELESYNAITKSAKNVIPLILIESDTKPKMQEEKQKLVQCLGKIHHPVTNKMKDGKPKGDSLLRADICKALAKHLTACTGNVLENCFDQTSSDFLTVDEYMPDCMDGKIHARKVIDPLLKVAVSERKKFCLPIQEDEWKRFCKLRKDRNRVCSETAEYTIQQQIDKIDLEMSQLREKQLNLVEHMSDVALQLTGSLMTGEQKVQFFLSWMKIMLDKESRIQTSELRRKYGAKWDELQTAKENKTENEIKGLQTQVSTLEHALAKASIGLEHMFREVGQIYEAVHEGSSEDKSATRQLPYVAADLLLKGYPLELLDGDAPGIPVTWIEAVFNQLKEAIGDKKLFVLSVLGIQSSGKSTLLNTMFGLQFAVSAGRCTRGAYMQLIPVDQSAGLPFNYVLVIDTEGLRAPELASSKHVHDNELATFAVGLADVTVVNIKGENVAEIQDVLQIVVHAFIRMKAVNSSKDYSRTCVFIHQNVSDTNAQDMMMHGRHKLVEKLDEMTREAALSEKMGDVTRFQQIIKFDISKHVWYFPDLWLGNPPMAPVNPEYSQKVEEVKYCLLNEITKNQQMFVNPSDLFIRIKDIWKGILSEDFVFNFRNSLEVRAYAQLDSMYNSLVWEIQEMVMTFIQDTATKKLTECKEVSSLDNVAFELIKKLERDIADKVEDLKKVLEIYFKENKYNEIIIQWKSTKMLGLINEGDKQKEESRTYMNNMKETCKMKIIQSQQAESHLKEIINGANQLADEMKGQGLHQDKIREAFNQMWIAFIQKNQLQTRNETVCVESIVQRVLLAVFKLNTELLRKELTETPLEVPLKFSLAGSMPPNAIKNAHLNQKSYFGKTCDFFRVTHNLSDAKAHLYNGTTHILAEVEQSLKNICNPREQVQDLTIKKLFKEVEKKIIELTKEMDLRGFLIAPAYMIKVAVLVGRQTVKQFQDTQKEYLANYSANAYVEKYHSIVWDLFKNRVKESTAEITVKDMFCHLIEQLLLEKTQERAALVLTSQVMNDFSHNKFNLIMTILKDLANKGSFDRYVDYIQSAKDFATNFLLRHFDDNIFTGKPSAYAKVATDKLGPLLQNLLKCVSEATKDMIENKKKSLAQWLQLIRSKSELSMPDSMFEPVCRQHDVHDYGHLMEIIQSELQSWENIQFEKFKNGATVSESWRTHLVEKVMQGLWGCPDHCPFCKEPCSLSVHQKDRLHSCIKHKPQGINNCVWETTNKLVTDTCGFCIHAKYSFRCSYVCGNCTSGKEWHSYEHYKQYVPEWDIQPDPANDSSKYWMWFMARFRHDLVRYYGAVLPDIPPSWEKITKQEALDDLG